MFYVSLFDSISNPLAEHTPIGKIHIKNSKDRQRKYHEIPFFVTIFVPNVISTFFNHLQNKAFKIKITCANIAHFW